MDSILSFRIRTFAIADKTIPIFFTNKDINHSNGQMLRIIRKKFRKSLRLSFCSFSPLPFCKNKSCSVRLSGSCTFIRNNPVSFFFCRSSSQCVLLRLHGDSATRWSSGAKIWRRHHAWTKWGYLWRSESVDAFSCACACRGLDCPEDCLRNDRSKEHDYFVIIYVIGSLLYLFID